MTFLFVYFVLFVVNGCLFFVVFCGLLWSFVVFCGLLWLMRGCGTGLETRSTFGDGRRSLRGSALQGESPVTRCVD